MAGQIRVSTAQVADIARTIESLNQKLSDELKTSQATVKNLSNKPDGLPSHFISNSTFSNFLSSFVILSPN